MRKSYGSAPSASWNSRSITHLENSPSRSLPTNSSDESKELRTFLCDFSRQQGTPCFLENAPMQPIPERQLRHGRTGSGARLAIDEELRRQMNELDLMTEELFTLRNRGFRSGAGHDRAGWRRDSQRRRITFCGRPAALEIRANRRRRESAPPALRRPLGGYTGFGDGALLTARFKLPPGVGMDSRCEPSRTARNRRGTSCQRLSRLRFPP